MADAYFTKASSGVYGLPFTSQSNTNVSFYTGYSSTASFVNYGHMNGGGTAITAWYNTSNGGVSFANGDRFMFGGTYTVA